ncbi:MAG: LysR family transcriptional regulator [Acutalibacter sp.]|jgi:DNA-binding transcriptional LysR family regulator
MTKRHLEIFVEVCSHMSFSQAAQTLGTTQPAVSLAIKELESHYGTRLFERMNRRVYLTAAGRTLLSSAQEILRGFQQAEDLLREGPSSLRVGANVTFGATRLPGLMSQLRQRFPQAELSALVVNSHKVQELLLSNQLDVGVVDEVSFLPQLRTFPLFREDMAVLCAPHFTPAPSTLEELARVPLLLREPGSGTRRSVDWVFQERGLSPQPFLESSSTAGLLAAAEAGLGVAIVAPSLAKASLDRGTLVRRELEGVRFPRQYSCALHRQKLSSPLLEECLRLLRQG